MKKLMRMLLNNWFYFKKQVIEFKNTNFLTGKNKAGKSTIIDAMQVVLLGEKNGIFNKAADHTSDRKLYGYLWGDDGTGSPRKGKSFETYIALEFYDDIKISYFTIGIIFECDAGGSFNSRYFYYEGQIPENLFYENEDTMDIKKLRNFLNDNYNKSKLFTTDTDYKNEILTRFNVHTEKYFAMMKKGVAFTPINDISKFITESICDIDARIDTAKMQGDVRDYQLQLKLAEDIERKIILLKNIHEAYLSMTQTLSTVKMQEYIVARAGYEANTEKLNSLYANLNKNKKEIMVLNQDILQSDSVIHDYEEKITNLYIALSQDDASNNAIRLEQQIKSYREKIDEINNQLNKLLRTIKFFASDLNSCMENIENSAINNLELKSEINQLKNKFVHLNNLSVDELMSKDKAFWNAYGQALHDFRQTVGQIKFIEEQKFNNLSKRKTEIAREISQLKVGQKPYDKNLLAFKQDLEDAYIKQTGQPLNSEFFADLIEMKDENWHNAVEGFLGKRKFYLIIDPEKYYEAFKIFKRIRRNSNYPLHLIGLADIGKIKEKERLDKYANCLADKVVAQNDNALVYINYLMGRIICCENSDDLREYKSAITRDGLLYQSYVQTQIPEERWRNPCIGKKSLKILLHNREEELKNIDILLKDYIPYISALSSYVNKDEFLSGREIDEQIIPCIEKSKLISLYDEEIAKLIKELGNIDLTYSTSIKKKIEEMDKLKKSEISKQDGFKDKRSKLNEKNEGIIKEASQLEKELESYNEKLKLAEAEVLPLEDAKLRYGREFERLKNHSAILSNFENNLIQQKITLQYKKEKLFDKRRDYNTSYPECGIDIKKLANDEYEKLLNDLSDIQLPQRKSQIEIAKKGAMDQFQNDFINILYDKITAVAYQIDELNRALKKGKFGKDSYLFTVDPNPDYFRFYEMIMNLGRQHGNALLVYVEQEKYRETIKELFGYIIGDDEQMNAQKQTELELNIQRYTDYRTYLKFDLVVTDANGHTQPLSKTIKSKSGGEAQTPFYIAMVAAFSQLYNTNEKGDRANTTRLVIFDEAFNKMDPERYTECINLFKDSGLQAIMCAPEKVDEISPLVDNTLYVYRDGYNMQVLPWTKLQEG